MIRKLTAALVLALGLLSGAFAQVTCNPNVTGTYCANNVSVTGGTINGAAIGGTTPAAGAFTTLSASTSLTIGGGTAISTYVEGTFTPTDASGAGLTLTSVSGRYIKVGKLVTAWLGVTYPATANTAAAALGNFPFTSVTDGTALGACTVSFNNSGAGISGAFISASTSFNIYNSATGVNIQNVGLTGKAVSFACTYQSAS